MSAAPCVPGHIATVHPGWSDLYLGRGELCGELGTSSESGGEGAVVAVSMGCVSLCTHMQGSN